MSSWALGVPAGSALRASLKFACFWGSLCSVVVCVAVAGSGEAFRIGAREREVRATVTSSKVGAGRSDVQVRRDAAGIGLLCVELRAPVHPALARGFGAGGGGCRSPFETG